jgi:hypothetical protein
LQKIFAAEPEIVSAAIARKQVVHFPRNPVFAVSLQIHFSWWSVRGSQTSVTLAQRVAKQVRLPGPSIIFVSEKKLKTLGTKVCQVPGAMIYFRPAKS